MKRTIGILISIVLAGCAAAPQKQPVSSTVGHSRVLETPEYVAQQAEARDVRETPGLDPETCLEMDRAVARMEGADPNDPAVIAEIANRRPGELSSVSVDRAIA